MECKYFLTVGSVVEIIWHKPDDGIGQTFVLHTKERRFDSSTAFRKAVGEEILPGPSYFNNYSNIHYLWKKELFCLFRQAGQLILNLILIK